MVISNGQSGSSLLHVTCLAIVRYLLTVLRCSMMLAACGITCRAKVSSSLSAIACIMVFVVASAGLLEELRSSQKQISELKSQLAQAQLPLLIAKAESLPSGAKLLVAQVEGMDAKSLQVVEGDWPLSCRIRLHSGMQ